MMRPPRWDPSNQHSAAPTPLPFSFSFSFLFFFFFFRFSALFCRFPCSPSFFFRLVFSSCRFSVCFLYRLLRLSVYLSKSDGYVCRLGDTGRTIRLATEYVWISVACVCWPAWLSHFISFIFSFSPLSLRGRVATYNTRTTFVSHSTVC